MLQRISDFQKVTPQQLNKVIEAVNRTDISVCPPLEITRLAGRTQLRVTEKGWMGVVSSIRCYTAPSSSASPDPAHNRYVYRVAEVSQLANGKWAVVNGGRFADDAFEWNDHQVALRTIVWVEPYGPEDYRFDWPVDDGTIDPCSSSSSSSSSGSSDSSGSSGSSSPPCNWTFSAAHCTNGVLEITWTNDDDETTATTDDWACPTCESSSSSSSSSGSGSDCVLDDLPDAFCLQFSDVATPPNCSGVTMTACGGTYSGATVVDLLPDAEATYTSGGDLPGGGGLTCGPYSMVFGVTCSPGFPIVPGSVYIRLGSCCVAATTYSWSLSDKDPDMDEWLLVSHADLVGGGLTLPVYSYNTIIDDVPGPRPVVGTLTITPYDGVSCPDLCSSSSSSSSSSSVGPTWNCVGNEGEPGVFHCAEVDDGSGVYATLEDCEAVCGTSSSSSSSSSGPPGACCNPLWVQYELDASIHHAMTLISYSPTSCVYQGGPFSYLGTLTLTYDPATDIGVISGGFGTRTKAAGSGSPAGIYPAEFTGQGGFYVTCGPPPATYNCDYGTYTCTDPGDGNGAYQGVDALANCEADCQAPPVTYNCDGVGGCYDPGDGGGFYTGPSALTDCEAACTNQCACVTLAIAGVGTALSSSVSPRYGCTWSGDFSINYYITGGSATLYVPAYGYYYISSGGPLGTYTLTYGYYGSGAPGTLDVTCAD